MPIGAMGYVMLASTAASAGASLYGANKAANASQQAAGLQVGATDLAAKLSYKATQDALDFQKQQWASTQSMMEPYVKAGQGAVSKLSHLLGVPGVSPNSWSAASASAPTSSSGVDLSSLPDLDGVDRSNKRTLPVGAVVTGTAKLRNPDDPRASLLSQLPTGSRTAPTASTRVPAGAGSPSTTGSTATTRTPTVGGKTVRMRAPDGTVQDVPEEYAEYYESLGAEVVS